MPLGILFWVLLVVGVLVSGWGWWTPTAPPFARWGGGLLIIVLIAILGWAVFGPVVSGSSAPTSTYRSR